MATILGIQVLGSIYAINIATDPSVGGGTVAPIGSFAGIKDGSGFWYKSGAGDTAWGQVAILTGGVLPPSLGGTGINNSTNTLTVGGNTSITGGGTIALGGFTATIPATGTVTLGSPGVAGRVFVATSGTTGAGNASLTYTSNELLNSVSSNSIIRDTVSNGNAGTSAGAEFHASASSSFRVRQYGTNFTTTGLVTGSLSALLTDSSVGVLFASTTASTKMWWAIGGTGTANEVMSLTSTALTVAVDIKLDGNFIAVDKVIDTTAGDSATINSIAGRFRKDTTGATFTLTNSYITANSIILLTAASDPGIASSIFYTVAGAGSAVITFQTIPLNNTDVNFWVIN